MTDAIIDLGVPIQLDRGSSDGCIVMPGQSHPQHPNYIGVLIQARQPPPWMRRLVYYASRERFSRVSGARHSIVDKDQHQANGSATELSQRTGVSQEGAKNATASYNQKDVAARLFTESIFGHIAGNLGLRSLRHNDSKLPCYAKSATVGERRCTVWLKPLTNASDCSWTKQRS